MKRLAQLLPLAVVALVLAGFALLAAPKPAAPPQSAATPAGNARNGKALFTSKMCDQCHGAAAQGTDAAPRLAGYPLAYGDFVHQVRTPANKMPAFDEAALSNAQIADIYAFLKSPPAAGGVAPLPTAAPRATSAGAAAPAAPGTPVALGPGNSQNGARIFVIYGCYQCHGRAAQGSPATGPRLAPNPISVEAMIHELRQPNEMPPYTERVISDAEINDIHAFLATLPQPPKPDSIPLLSR